MADAARPNAPPEGCMVSVTMTHGPDCPGCARLALAEARATLRRHGLPWPKEATDDVDIP